MLLLCLPSLSSPAFAATLPHLKPPQERPPLAVLDGRCDSEMSTAIESSVSGIFVQDEFGMVCT